MEEMEEERKRRGGARSNFKHDEAVVLNIDFWIDKAAVLNNIF